VGARGTRRADHPPRADPRTDRGRPGLRAIAGAPDRLRTSYAPDGTHHTPTRQLHQPTDQPTVHVGDTDHGPAPAGLWGEVLDTLHTAEDTGLADPGAAWDIRRGLLDHLEASWDRPGGGPRQVGGHEHRVLSKVMAWVALDRAVRAAERHGLPGPVGRWRTLRRHIRAEVCGKGYDPNRNTFTRCYGSSDVDAELLKLPTVGFLPWQDARVRGTVEAVHARFQQDDQVPFLQGVRLADALCGIGRPAEATALFQRLLSRRNDVGLLAAGTQHHTACLVAFVNTAHRLAAHPDPHRPVGHERGAEPPAPR
jgi:GH15 family glucan-1,4-alpha-glucosidase